ncbi:NAD(P)-dependent oxidoreductase [Plantactinospora sp. B5E13]|uniref:NAD-dependent epimerase/dehydratase family protein n=1 Tax=unclassified Plantactinospora TaxID=2631981 RepID=UPI00325F6CBC
MSRILVAGASGLLGSAVVRALVAAGHQVWGTTRQASRIPLIGRLGGHGIVLDALDRASVDAALERAAPDVVVHELTDLAGLDFAANRRLRIDGTAHLVGSMLDHGVTRLVAQSISWAYRPGPTPATEREPFATVPETGEPAYDAIELLEREVARIPCGVALRYGLLYGPGTWYAPDGAQTARARQGRIEATTAWTSWVHVDDAVEATVRALDWPAGPVNIVDDDPTHVDEWGPGYARAAGYRGTPRISSRAPGRAASNALARAAGWTPRHPTWRTTLTDPAILAREPDPS